MNIPILWKFGCPRDICKIKICLDGSPQNPPLDHHIFSLYETQNICNLINDSSLRQICSCIDPVSSLLSCSFTFEISRWFFSAKNHIGFPAAWGVEEKSFSINSVTNSSCLWDNPWLSFSTIILVYCSWYSNAVGLFSTIQLIFYVSGEGLLLDVPYYRSTCKIVPFSSLCIKYITWMFCSCLLIPYVYGTYITTDVKKNQGNK